MPTRRAKDVATALVDKGMERDDSGHHIMFRKELDGVTHLVTRISHGTKEIDDHLGTLMGRQCYLQLREFWQLVDCPMSAERWDKLVVERSVGGRNPFLGR